MERQQLPTLLMWVRFLLPVRSPVMFAGVMVTSSAVAVESQFEIARDATGEEQELSSAEP